MKDRTWNSRHILFIYCGVDWRGDVGRQIYECNLRGVLIYFVFATRFCKCCFGVWISIYLHNIRTMSRCRRRARGLSASGLKAGCSHNFAGMRVICQSYKYTKQEDKMMTGCTTAGVVCCWFVRCYKLHVSTYIKHGAAQPTCDRVMISRLNKLVHALGIKLLIVGWKYESNHWNFMNAV